MEKTAFEQLMTDALKPFVPLYFKSVVMQDDGGNPVEYVGMQDLLGLFNNPSVMDIKMVSHRRGIWGVFG